MLTRIRFGGLGGQGIVMAGSLLGQAATLAGLYAAGSNSYGAAARGTACRADVVVSDGEIAYPHVTTADMLAVMSRAALEKYLPTLVPGGLVFADDFAIERAPEGDFTCHLVGATRTAVREFGSRQGANIILLGVVLGTTGIFAPEWVEEAIRRTVPPRFRDWNLRALALGFELGRTLRTEGRS